MLRLNTNEKDKSLFAGVARKSVLLSSVAVLLCAQVASAEQFLVAGQPLQGALSEISGQTSIAIHYDPRIVKGISSATVQGDMSVGDALRQMVSGTDLEVVQTDSGDYFVLRKGDNPADFDNFLTAKPLDEVVVTATGLRTGTTSQVMTIDTLENANYIYFSIFYI